MVFSAAFFSTRDTANICKQLSNRSLILYHFCPSKKPLCDSEPNANVKQSTLAPVTLQGYFVLHLQEL